MAIVDARTDQRPRPGVPPGKTDGTFFALLAPEDLARIDDFSFLARTVVENVLSGLHQSTRQGYGSEFFQYRSYVPGDPLKYLDWKVFARSDRYYIKRFQEETNMNVVILLDASASMAYRGARSPCSKLRYAAMLAACVAYLARRQGDHVGLFAYADDARIAIPPGMRGTHLQRLFAELSQLRPGGVADHVRIVEGLLEQGRKRGAVWIISDLLEAEDALSHVLRILRASDMEAVVVQVLDQDELDLPFHGPVRFVDAEHRTDTPAAVEAVRRGYRRDMAEFLDRIDFIAREQGADCFRAQTTDNLGLLLAAYLHTRRARR